MRFLSIALLFASVILAIGCTASLDALDDAQLACSSDDDCPGDGRCNRGTQLCVFGDQEFAPSVTVAPESTAFRPLEHVDFQVTVVDPDTSGQTVELAVSFTVNDSAPCSATIVEPVDSLSLDTEGSTYSLQWDALADVGNCGLSSRMETIDALGTQREVVSFAERVRLLVTATDDSSQVSAATPSAEFAIGNDPVAVVLGAVDEEQRFAVPIEFSLGDAAADTARLEFQIRSLPDGVFRPLPVEGSTEDLGASLPEALASRLVVWDSVADPEFGLQNAEVELQGRAVEEIDAGQEGFGAWSTVRFNVRNQSAPRVESLVPFALEPLDGASDSATTRIEFEYRVVDEEDEPVDIRAEYSLDGTSWQPATA
ncbi:MAG: hypothetical protein AAFQ82_16370, partial [Myxococcota bacterium]